MEDLDTAKSNLKIGKYYAASFFSQQAAEKALKSLYLKKFKDVIKTHDLLFLARKLELSKELVDVCGELTPIYIETRYPDANSFKKYTKIESERDIELANKVLQWIEKNL